MYGGVAVTNDDKIAAALRQAVARDALFAQPLAARRLCAAQGRGRRRSDAGELRRRDSQHPDAHPPGRGDDELPPGLCDLNDLVLDQPAGGRQLRARLLG